MSSSSSSSFGSSSSSLPKKRAVQKKTVEEWISQHDKLLNTSVWLKFDTADRHHVATLRCPICSQFKTQLESMRNFRPAFIDGTTKVRISSQGPCRNGHAHSSYDTYSIIARACMILYKKQRSTNICDFCSHC